MAADCIEEVTDANKDPKETYSPKDDQSHAMAMATAKPNGHIVAAAQQRIIDAMTTQPVELDDFGLPIKRFATPSEKSSEAGSVRERSISSLSRRGRSESRGSKRSVKICDPEADDDDHFEDARSVPRSSRSHSVAAELGLPEEPVTPVPPTISGQLPRSRAGTGASTRSKSDSGPPPKTEPAGPEVILTDKANEAAVAAKEAEVKKKQAIDHSRDTSIASSANVMGEFSHQQLATKTEEEADDGDGEWQEMPAYAPYDIYDDDNRLIAREHNEEEDEKYGYAGLGGAGKGYTRVLIDEDAESATSMDENTKYLFKDVGGTSMMEDDEQTRDAVSQMQATKDLLTEGQRVAYVGLTRLELSGMVKDLEKLETTRKTKKEITMAAEATKMWSQKMMIRLYSHMDISSAEQVMIEQLDAHGVIPSDLTSILMANARVKNPMAEKRSPDRAAAVSQPTSPRPSTSSAPSPPPPAPEEEQAAEPPPPYEAHAHDGDAMLDVKTPSQLPTTDKIDIDIRWTVLCDLFLVLVADSVYDARSRVLLERVSRSLEIPWIDICRFERRVTDALEMQQQAERENWNEDGHMEARRKQALTRRYVMMGLATVGGGLVIGLSAGLLAPMIGAGLAAGFTTIGVTGTGSFLAGAGGAAIITSSAAASGSLIGGRAANRRTGSVKTFEYRPLHNNKRVNLIVTVSGWMTGKVDDVRLPYSTVDPVMGDIYSVLWEPEMLTSMGDTINILATEALTQGLQQILGSTILVSLMAALQLPLVLTKISYLIDNPWAVSLDRATAAGLILADSLIDRNLGTRPVTLVGYSLGSRLIFSCLQELARKGAYGLVQNVYLFGSPVVVKKDEYLRARSVVAGRFVNAFNRNDWILGYLFRLTNGGIRRVGGLAAIEDVPGIENMDVTEFVKGHMDYRKAMPRLLRECGWLVESDEFTEIEDPDPENHTERQRELINEIEEARKELEKEAAEAAKSNKKASGFGLFGRKKKALEKAEWEVYEDSLKKEGGGSGHRAAEDGKNGDVSAGSNNQGVLFDVEAIRAELAKESLQVRELQSTLPPMKLDLSPRASLSPASPRDALRETRSADPVATTRTSTDARRLSQDQRTPTLPRSAPGGGGGLSPMPSPRPGSSRSVIYTGTRDDAPGLSPKPVSSPAGRTPTTPSRDEVSSRYEVAPSFAGDDGDDGMRMTFDTDYAVISSPPPPPPPPKDTRPELSSRSTAPNMALADPWADMDDDDFGKEQEIQMTFA